MKIKKRELGVGKPLICVPVMERTAERIIEEITCLAQSAADMIEWRVDMFDGFRDFNEVRKVLRAVEPVIGDKLFLYTFRTKLQGGAGEADAEMLADLHELAAECGGVDLVDLEYFEEKRPQKKIRSFQEKGVRVIASHHDFEETPSIEVMQMLLEHMYEGGADIVKLAVMPQTPEDVLKLLYITAEFRKKHPSVPIITMSMGALGGVSRLCGESFGSCVTFGAHQQCSAPGQFQMDGLAQTLSMIHQGYASDVNA